MILGLDLSHYKPGANLAKAKAEGYQFCILKATEGNTFIDSTFRSYLSQCRDVGMVFAAYHYYKSSVTVARQLDWIESHIPHDVPVILDCERGSGESVAMWRTLIGLLKDKGYSVPLIYIPKWYWSLIGSPSLEGLPPLWGSHYVTGQAHGKTLFQAVRPDWWGGYGNNYVAMLQFSSSALVDGCPPDIDISAFVGSETDIRHLFGSGTMNGGTTVSSDFTDAVIADLNRGMTAWDPNMSENRKNASTWAAELRQSQANTELATEAIDNRVLLVSQQVAVMRQEIARLSDLFIQLSEKVATGGLSAKDVVAELRRQIGTMPGS